MQSLPPKFEEVKRHVEGLGVEVTVAPGSRLMLPFAFVGERFSGFRFPRELGQFRNQVGDGFTFTWRLQNDEEVQYGGFDLMKVSETAAMLRSRRNGILYDPEEAEEYGFPHTKNPELAKKTAARMWDFLPVIDFGEGDAISIDRACNELVVFDQHDWMDGGSGDNGFKIGESWNQFIEAWALLCFQWPKMGYWPSVISSNGIDWASDAFDDRFRLD